MQGLASHGQISEGAAAAATPEFVTPFLDEDITDDRVQARKLKEKGLVLPGAYP